MVEALAQMWRDFTEAPLLVAFMVLSAVVAGFALRRGSRLALVPMGILAAQLGVWFLSYATDWFSNRGMAGVWTLFIIPTMVGLTIVIAALASASSSER